MAAIGWIFMVTALTRELTVVICLGWPRGLMSSFTASKTEVHNFQQRPVRVVCKLFKSGGLAACYF